MQHQRRMFLTMSVAMLHPKCQACDRRAVSSLTHALVQVLLHVPVVHQHQESEEHTTEETEAFTAAEAEMRQIAALASAILHKEKTKVPAELTQLVLTLHDQALLQLAFTPSVSDAVLKLCIDYFLMQAPDHEHVCTQMVRAIDLLRL